MGLFAFWLLLSGGRGPGYAAVAAVAGGIISAWLAPGLLHQPRPLAIIRFLALFIQQSLVGGADVAWRAMRPSMPLNADWHDYPVSLRTPAGQSLLLITVSLTPGTLCVDMHNGVMRAHVLTPAMADGIPRVERAIAAIFGEELREAAA